MWQRKYAASRDRLLPSERAALQREKVLQQEELFAQQQQSKGYRCLECGYWSQSDLSCFNETFYCPACGAKIQIVQVFALCPRCSNEQNVSYLAPTLNNALHDPDEFWPRASAKALCPDCQRKNRRLPKAYKEQGATVTVRKVVLVEERSE